jgi:hypothetical protein
MCGAIVSQKQFKAIKPYDCWICQDCRDVNIFRARHGRPPLEMGARKPKPAEADPQQVPLHELPGMGPKLYVDMIAAAEVLGDARDDYANAELTVDAYRDALAAVVDLRDQAAHDWRAARERYEAAEAAYKSAAAAAGNEAQHE